MNRIASGSPRGGSKVFSSKAATGKAGQRISIRSGTLFVLKKCDQIGGVEYYDQAPFKFNGKILGAQVKYLGADAKLNAKEERQIEGPIPVAD